MSQDAQLVLQSIQQMTSSLNQVMMFKAQLKQRESELKQREKYQSDLERARVERIAIAHENLEMDRQKFEMDKASFAQSSLLKSQDAMENERHMAEIDARDYVMNRAGGEFDDFHYESLPKATEDLSRMRAAKARVVQSVGGRDNFLNVMAAKQAGMTKDEQKALLMRSGATDADAAAAVNIERLESFVNLWGGAYRSTIDRRATFAKRAAFVEKAEVEKKDREASGAESQPDVEVPDFVGPRMPVAPGSQLSEKVTDEFAARLKRLDVDAISELLTDYPMETEAQFIELQNVLAEKGLTPDEVKDIMSRLSGE